MLSKILLALGVVLAISALGKKIYKFSVIESQCLMFLASNMQLSEKMWEAISFKLHRIMQLLDNVAILNTSQSDLQRFWQTLKSHLIIKYSGFKIG